MAKQMGKKKRITIKLDVGTVYQKAPGDFFYYRYQVNGGRKTVSLKTKDQREAEEEAKKLMQTVKATSVEVIAAHVGEARKLAKRSESLFLSDAWRAYSQHPDRATPATVSERKSYEATFTEFVRFIDRPTVRMDEITHADAERFADYLRTQGLAVDTHNRKIKRLRKVFSTLKAYWQGESPFASNTLFRKTREEHDLGIRRLSFTREQEAQLLSELENPARKLMNKNEIRLIFLLGMFTGQRLKDCVLLRWSAIDLNRRIITITQYKTGKKVSLPIAPQLMQGLEEALAWKTGETAYVCPKVAERYNRTDANGKNTGNGLVNIDVLRVIKWLGVETSVKAPGRNKSITVYGFHSLRHSFVSYCAAAGVPKSVVQSFTGTDAQILDHYYTHVGSEQQLKALEAVAGGITGRTAQDKIDQALGFIDGLQEPNADIIRIRALLTQD